MSLGSFSPRFRDIPPEARRLHPAAFPSSGSQIRWEDYSSQQSHAAPTTTTAPPGKPDQATQRWLERLGLPQSPHAILTVKVGHFGQDHPGGGGPQPLVQLEGAGAELEGVGSRVRSLHLGVGIGEGCVLRCQRGRRRRVPVHGVPIKGRLGVQPRAALKPQSGVGVGVGVRVLVLVGSTRGRATGQEAGLGHQAAVAAEDTGRRWALRAQAFG